MASRELPRPQPNAKRRLLIGESGPISHLRRCIAAVARRACTVLVDGETGVGKEIVAREIHALSDRNAGPFVPVDCTTLTESLFESQLFGHLRGAFTGAEGNTLGFFRCAHEGTLFLDEIGELPLPAQAKLLRCIQDRAVRPLGGVEAIAVNVRIVAATHRDLGQMVKQEAFREDLFFRLNVVNIRVPPLRSRREDILLLADHLLHECASLYDEPPKLLSTAAQAALMAYEWPGNVRELRNAVERAFVFCIDRMIDSNSLPPRVLNGAEAAKKNLPTSVKTLEQAERELIATALKASRGNQSQAARLLDVERHRLHRMILRLGLQGMTRPRGG